MDDVARLAALLADVREAVAILERTRGDARRQIEPALAILLDGMARAEGRLSFIVRSSP